MVCFLITCTWIIFDILIKGQIHVLKDLKVDVSAPNAPKYYASSFPAGHPTEMISFALFSVGGISVLWSEKKKKHYPNVSKTSTRLSLLTISCLMTSQSLWQRLFGLILTTVQTPTAISASMALVAS